MAKLFGTILFLVALTFSSSVSAQESIVENICNGAFDLLNEACSSTISIPTGVEVDYTRSCTNNCCVWDCCQDHWCCSWTSCGYDCEVCGAFCSGCSKPRCGETCVDVPDTLRLTETEYSICDLAQATIPGINAVQEAAQWCPCLTQVIDYISDGLLDTIDSLEYNEATAVALGAVGDIVDCIADQTTGIDSNKDEVMAEVQSQKGAILLAPEIGLKQYIQFVGAVVLCALSGKCDDILTVMKDVFVNTVSMIGPALVDELRDYYVGKVFGPVLGVVDTFATLKESSEAVTQSFLDEVESCAEALADETTADLKALVSTYNETKSVLMDKIDLVNDVATKIMEAADAVEGALDVIDSAIDALETPFIEQIQNLFESGEKPELYEAIKFLIENEHIETVLEAATGGVEFLQSLEEHVQDFTEQVTALETAVLDLVVFESCDLDATAVVDVEGLLDGLELGASKALEEVEEVLANPIDGIKLLPDVASYSSEWTIKIENLPCSRLERQTFTSDLCPGCNAIVVDVPVFEPCTYEMKIPLPNEHTPYLHLMLPE